MFYIALDAMYDYLLTSEITTTLYYSIHRTLNTRKIFKYLKNWRSKLAKIQHSLIHSTLSPPQSDIKQWYVKKPTRTTEITRTPYGH
jgi:hypothetical protein